MNVLSLFNVRSVLLVTALAACSPPGWRGDVDMSVRGDPTSPGISSTSTQITAAGTILQINGTFSAPSDLDVLIDEQPAQQLPESTSSALLVRVPASIAATTVAREVVVTVYSSSDVWSTRATLPASSPR